MKKTRQFARSCKALNGESICEARPPLDQELSGGPWVPGPSLTPIHREADPSTALQWASPVNHCFQATLALGGELYCLSAKTGDWRM